jgi:2'-5' RNA ligase
LGVVLLVPEPWCTEVDGLRRALGDEALPRVASHLTLVPPVNVREDDLAAAFDLVHETAAACPPLTLRLGPVATFAPVNPVAYLAVSGDAGTMARLLGLKEALLTGPLERVSEHDYIPHVTVANELPEDRLAASALALSDYRAEVTFERVHVLAEQQPGRIWVPVAEAELGGS